MPREITRIEVPDPEPMHQTDDGGAETQGAAYRLSAPAVATEPLTVTAPDGTALTWVPTELCYRDESGQMDYIVGSAPATVQVRDHEARYKRTFPVADDVFLAEAERVKHWVILHEPPRAPAEYLSGAIEFGITGVVSGVILPEGRHDEIEAGPFRLPKPMARDLSGKEIEGYYEVVAAEDGQQLFVWFSADAILGAVYPVTIDPTIRSSQASDATQLDNGIALAADGAYYALVKDNTAPYLFVYKTTDLGQTWVDTNFPGMGLQGGDMVGAIVATPDGLVRVYYYDVIDSARGIYECTYDGSQWSSPVLIEAIAATDSFYGIVARAREDGSIHLVWQESHYNGSTYTYPIKYKRFAGGQWQATRLVYDHPLLNQSRFSADAVGQTVIVAMGGAVGAHVSTDGGETFQFLSVDSGLVGLRPHVFADRNGELWLAYVTSSNQVAVRKWTGSGFSPAEIVGSVSTPTSVLGIQTDSTSVVVWSDSQGVRYVVRQGGAWSAPHDLLLGYYAYVMGPQKGRDIGFPVVVRYGSSSPYTVVSETISLNQPPNAPILGPQANFDATEDAVFSWTFSDPDAGDSQSAYQLLIKRAADGVTVYDTGKVASSAEQHTVPGGTLSNGVQYRWTVRTWDALDQVGPYATEQSFLTSAKPSVTITDPASDGAVIGTASYTIQWSMSDPESKGQSAYQVVLKDGGGNVVHDSGKVLSTTARAYTLQNLQNNTSYTVELTVWDGDGVASAVATRTFQVQYTPPPQPAVTVEALEAWVRITIANNNAGAEIQAVSNDVYRRKVGEAGNGIRIATNVPIDGVVYDYAVASGVAYEYRVVAVGVNGATTASAWVQAPVLALTGAWIHDPADPANTIRQFRVSAAQERGEEWAPAMELLHPAGREHPIAEFGEQTDQRVKTAIIVLPDSLADLHALRRLADMRTVLCYRDSAGRRIFGVLGPLNIRDERHGGYTVEIEIQAVDCDEAV